jgi:hypothetical protein
MGNKTLKTTRLDRVFKQLYLLMNRDDVFYERIPIPFILYSLLIIRCVSLVQFTYHPGLPKYEAEPANHF